MPRDIHPRLKVLPQARTGLDLAVEIFLTAKEASRCTARTVANYRWYLEKFQEWLQATGVSHAEGITAHHIRLFLAEVDKRGAAAGYTHTYAKIIKTWMRFLLAENLIPANPMSNVEMPRLDKEILPAFTPDDVHKLLDACSGVRERAIVLCLIDTGCRAAELCALRVGDIDLKSGAVMVRQGKGRKDRITLCNPVVERLGRLFCPCQPVDRTMKTNGRPSGASMPTPAASPRRVGVCGASRMAGRGAGCMV